MNNFSMSEDTILVLSPIDAPCVIWGGFTELLLLERQDIASKKTWADPQPKDEKCKKLTF